MSDYCYCLTALRAKGELIGGTRKEHDLPSQGSLRLTNSIGLVERRDRAEYRRQYAGRQEDTGRGFAGSQGCEGGSERPDQIFISLAGEDSGHWQIRRRVRVSFENKNDTNERNGCGDRRPRQGALAGARSTMGSSGGFSLLFWRLREQLNRRFAAQ